MTKQITNRIIDYINDKLEQIEYYKRPQNMVDVLSFIKDEVLAAHDIISAKETEMSVKNAEISMLRDRVADLEADVTQLSQNTLATRVHELETEAAELRIQNERLLQRQRDLAEMGVFEDVLRHPRTV
jgi:DNA-binding HxlR family transcriptional regulator